MDHPMPEPIDMTKPADTYIAEPELQVAERARDGGSAYRAIWAVPGLLPAYCEERNGAPILFQGWTEARTGAVYAVFHALVSRAERRTRGKEMRHEHMTPEEFAVALAKLGIEPTEFANLWGSRRDRVMDWIEGNQPVPFALWWAMELLGGDRGYNLELAKGIAARHMEKR